MQYLRKISLVSICILVWHNFIDVLLPLGTVGLVARFWQDTPEKCFFLEKTTYHVNSEYSLF